MKLRFSIRDLLWLMLAVALCVGWWLDRSRLAQALDKCEFQLLLTSNIRISTGILSDNEDNDWAERRGWLREFERGNEIIRDLACLRPDQVEKVDIAAYCDECVAFVGEGVGSSNDLLTAEDFYLRVITPSNKDLRPTSVWWQVRIRGKILQVLPKHKTIVIEVDEGDWEIGDTG